MAVYDYIAGEKLQEKLAEMEQAFQEAGELALAKEYPQYQLEKHKGYPTKLHYELLDKYGVQPFYRKSFLKKRGYV